MYHECYWGMPMMWFIWFPILVIAIIVIVKLLSGNKEKSSQKESPMEILRKRFASGEITKEEYEERKKILEKV